MRRRWWVALAAVVVALVAAVSALGSNGNDDDGGDGYRVRAVFDNASFIIPGEDVKVGGVIAGKIEKTELSDDNKAIVVFSLDPAFQNLRQDATCHVGLQSLIGEQFIECVPTQPRGEGVAPVAPLAVIKDGPGKGQRFLPVTQTSSPVGPDLLADIMRVPQQDRFRLILGELGVGLAGNGTELRAAISRANPALQQTNRVIQVLADQNELIARLATQSDQALAPLAAKRKDLSGFIRTAGQTAQATAERGDALEQNFALFPSFLQQLKPAMERISALSDQLGPSVANLSSQADSLNKVTTNLGPFFKAATPAFVSLGDVADRGRKTFPEISNLVDRAGKLTKPLGPLAKDLANLGDSFDQQNGITNLLRTIYYFTAAMNGKDGISHYLRASLFVNQCADRTAQYDAQALCSARFSTTPDRELAQPLGTPAPVLAATPVAPASPPATETAPETPATPETPAARSASTKSSPGDDAESKQFAQKIDSLLGAAPKGTR